MADKKPNVLIFMADHFMADAVAPGKSQCITPNADRLASDGVRFTNAFCPTPHCCPARASFQTGEYPSIHGVWNNVSNRCAINRDINDGVLTMGDHLSTGGYQLYYSGKWHVSDLRSPADFGWETGACSPPMLQWQGSRIDAFEPEVFAQAPYNDRASGVLRRPGWQDLSFYGETEHDDSVWVKNLKFYDTLDKIDEYGQHDDPWCIMFSCNPPHDPYQVPEKYLKMYDDIDIQLPDSYADDLKDKPNIYRRMRYQTWNQLGEEGTKEARRHYFALCSMIDDWFGQMLDRLEASGQAENTIVVLTSDHGDYAGAHGLFAKGIPAFREGYNIPAIIRWPHAGSQPGRVVNELVSICDFMPTLLDAAGLPSPEVYGRSLLPFIKNEPVETWRDDLHFQMNGVELYYTQRTVITDKWKYVYNGFDFDELYDLEHDPGEMVNLAHPDRYETLAPFSTNAAGQFVPYPPMPPELDKVRKELYRRIWKFAREQNDQFAYTPYITTGQAVYGPNTAFADPVEI
jgi:arylsulfatase A-like enzyme